MRANKLSFQIHDVFRPLKLMPEVAGTFRVIDTVGFTEVIVINIDTKKLTVPYAIGYDRCESPRVSRRLNTLRGLSHEQVEQVLARGA